MKKKISLITADSLHGNEKIAFMLAEQLIGETMKAVTTKMTREQAANSVAAYAAGYAPYMHPDAWKHFVEIGSIMAASVPKADEGTLDLDDMLTFLREADVPPSERSADWERLRVKINDLAYEAGSR